MPSVQVDSYRGKKTYSSFFVCPHPAGVEEPFLRGDQVPQQIVLAVLAHTLLTAEYVKAFFKTACSRLQLVICPGLLSVAG